MTPQTPLAWLFVACLALPVQAGEAPVTRTQVIPVYSVSPGASGSVDSSARSQSYELIGGRAVPEGGYATQYRSASGSSRLQSQGALRQSIEYPNGRRVEVQSGEAGYRYEEQR